VGALAAVWGATRAGVRSLAFYGPAALAAWLCLLQSGVHATLSGVALALLTPTASFYTDEEYRDRARRILAGHEAAAVAAHAASESTKTP